MHGGHVVCCTERFRALFAVLVPIGAPHCTALLVRVGSWPPIGIAIAIAGAVPVPLLGWEGCVGSCGGVWVGGIGSSSQKN